MTKKELVCSVFQSLGYTPTIDDDGDVMIRYQMKSLYVATGDENDPYLSVILPQFYEIGDGEDALVLATCNKVTRDIKLAKVYIDQTFKNVSAMCEFYYTDKESLGLNLYQSLRILGQIRTTFRNARMELSE